MKTVQISLNSIDKVKSFVNDITKFDYDFDLIHADAGLDEILEILKPYIISK